MELFFRFAYDKNGNEIGVCINNGYYRDNFMAIIEDVSIRILQLSLIVVVQIWFRN